MPTGSGRIKARLLVSRAAIRELGEAGISVDWLIAWLRQAGAHAVDLDWLESSEPGVAAADWCLAVGEEALLMRLALAHGRRIRIDDVGSRGLHGGVSVELDNPRRTAWAFETSDGGRCVLLPLGDVAYQRERWLHLLNDGAPLAPLYVSLAGEADEADGLPLEAGLRGWLESPPEGCPVLNDGGYLPEEWLAMRLDARGWRVRFAESCTAGGMAERFSRLPGVSSTLDAAWTTYSNEAKHRLLNVPKGLIEHHGAVSREVAEAMATGGADGTCACLAATGIAGPGGGSPDKPVGTVWIAAALPDGRVTSRLLRLAGSRAAIRRQTVNHAFALLSSLT